MIGLTGSSGCGKTTLAKKLSSELGIQFVPSMVREGHRLCGMSSAPHYNFSKRMQVQNKILDLAEQSYKDAERGFVSDRTPLDMLAYTMADVGRTNLSPQHSNMFFDYIQRCFEVANMHFGTIVVVQPGIQMVNDGGRPTCGAYAEHINSIIMGLVTDQRMGCVKYFINRDIVDLEKRMNVVIKIAYSLDKMHKKQIEVAGVH